MFYEIIDVANTHDVVTTEDFDVAILLTDHASKRGHAVSLLAFREQELKYPMIGWIVKDGKVTALLTERDFKNLSE